MRQILSNQTMLRVVPARSNAPARGGVQLGREHVDGIDVLISQTTCHLVAGGFGGNTPDPTRDGSGSAGVMVMDEVASLP